MTGVYEYEMAEYGFSEAKKAKIRDALNYGELYGNRFYRSDLSDRIKHHFRRLGLSVFYPLEHLAEWEPNSSLRSLEGCLKDMHSYFQDDWLELEELRVWVSNYTQRLSAFNEGYQKLDLKVPEEEVPWWKKEFRVLKGKITNMLRTFFNGKGLNDVRDALPGYFNDLLDRITKAAQKISVSAPPPKKPSRLETKFNRAQKTISLFKDKTIQVAKGIEKYIQDSDLMKIRDNVDDILWRLGKLVEEKDREALSAFAAYVKSIYVDFWYIAELLKPYRW